MIKLTNRDDEHIFINGKLVKIKKRYPDNEFLCHICGYFDGKNGTGIEKAFYNELKKENTTEKILNDALGKPAAYLKNNAPKDYSGIILTIDYHIQKICEEAL